MVSFTEIVDLDSLDVPTQHEATRLIRIVAGRFPELAPPDADERGYTRMFVNALAFLSFVRRESELNPDHGLAHFVDAAAAWFRQHDTEARRTNAAALLCAAIASGDIAYRMGHRWPFASLALSSHGMTGKPQSQWRRVLNAGKAPEPVQD